MSRSNTCGNCKWWVQFKPPIYTMALRLGECDCPEMARREKYISTNYAEHISEIEFHRDFGCIFHEPKQEAR